MHQPDYQGPSGVFVTLPHPPDVGARGGALYEIGHGEGNYGVTHRCRRNRGKSCNLSHPLCISTSPAHMGPVSEALRR